METYLSAGVDTKQLDVATKLLVDRIKGTWPKTEGTGSVRLDFGLFANVINVGGVGISISTDGVGTKALIAQMMKTYDTIGIDLVAMNVNDLLCVGSTPLSIVDYIALQNPFSEFVDEIAKGLCDGAKIANISIPGGEVAQLKDVIKGHNNEHGFDLVGTAIGIVPLDKIIVGKDIQPGDVVIGIESSGIHCNGLSLARKVFFKDNDFTVDSILPSLSNTLGEELLVPTHIYVPEVVKILESEISVKALINITSGGFLNLARVDSGVGVGYEIEELPPPPPIFSLIQEFGNVSDNEMFSVYNMGIGFCVVVPPEEAEHVISIVHKHERRAYKIGHTTSDEDRNVYILPKGLVGNLKNKQFENI